MRPLKDHVALVTGGSSGIGEAIAVRLASLGVRTAAASRRVEAMAHLKSKGIKTIRLDLEEAQSIKDCYESVVTEIGDISILVNAAGYGHYGAVEDVSIDEARRQFEVNLFGLSALTQLVIPSMRSHRQGTIVNISSIGGVSAAPFGAWYHASKFALEGYSSALRQELKLFGVDVVVLRPGAIDTGWREIAGASLLKNSKRSAYEEAASAMHAKFMSAEFEKILADPSVIADVVEVVVKARSPLSSYTAPRLARNLVRMNNLMLTDRIRDSFTRRFIGLPSKL
jgi:short-subunit dehydrogenase